MYLWEGENDGEWIWSGPSPDDEDSKKYIPKEDKDPFDVFGWAWWTVAIVYTLIVAYPTYRIFKEINTKNSVRKYENINKIKSLNMKQTYIFGR